MKNIYLTTTLILLAISGILGAIGVRPVQHAPVAKNNVEPTRFVAQASKPDQKL